jgi:penicillin-binding protein 1B
MPLHYLAEHLAARGYERVDPPLRVPGTWTPTAAGAEILLRGFTDAPDPAGTGGPERVRLVIDRGRLARVERLGGPAGARAPDTAHAPRLEPYPIGELTDSLRVRRTWVPLARIPRVLRDAVIASEDRRFRAHLGLDLRSNLRALATNVRAGGVRQGASTITQQLARGLFLGRERTWSRKLAEAALAVGLEVLLSKDEILEMYLNSVYWGQDGGGGIAGATEAARWYFDAPLESLRVEQAALLAGLIPAPNAFSPFVNPRAALERRNAVLQAMAETGRLGARDAAALRARPLGVRRGTPAPVRFPSFAGVVRGELARALPEDAAEHWGLAVLTTLDLVAQARTESTLAAAVGSLEARLGLPHHALEGAVVAMEARSGAVRALVGGRDPGIGDFNRATQALRQPGSAIKPIVFTAALDSTRGAPRFTPASTLPDLRRAFPTPEGPWTPRNDHDEYHPEVSLAKALAKSLNVATANLVEAIGASTVARYAERFGLGRMKPVASIGLGSNEVTLIALTGAYAVFANRGERVPPRLVRAVVDARGRDLLRPAPPPARVIPRATADLMTGLLEDVVLFGVAYPLRADYGFTRPVAGKTGTTNDFNDGWFIGFTPGLVTGVWVGCDTPRSLGDVAAATALRVWAAIEERLLEGVPVPPGFAADSTLETAWIDPWSGALAGPACPHPMRVPFLPGTRPTRGCTTDHAAEPDSAAADSAAMAPD